MNDPAPLKSGGEPQDLVETLARAIHKEWRDGMLKQKRHVAPERMDWDTLDPCDRTLDRTIARRLIKSFAIVSQPVSTGLDATIREVQKALGTEGQPYHISKGEPQEKERPVVHRLEDILAQNEREEHERDLGKPSIAELEQMIDDDRNVEIKPDGRVVEVTGDAPVSAAPHNGEETHMNTLAIPLQEAVRMALDELGEPQPGYPAPVANAIEILQNALADNPLRDFLAARAPQGETTREYAVGLCKTTSTLRHRRVCVCPTYPENLGCCGTWEVGDNGRCAYCDHEQRCHRVSAQQGGDAALRAVEEMAATHSHRWQGKPNDYWLYRLMQEVGELASVLAKDHLDTLEHELTQVGSIAVNWLRRLTARPEGAAQPTLQISDEEIELVRSEGEGDMQSFGYPDTPDDRQPAEWRDGKKLVGLADRLAAYRAATQDCPECGAALCAKCGKCTTGDPEATNCYNGCDGLCYPPEGAAQPEEEVGDGAEPAHQEKGVG